MAAAGGVSDRTRKMTERFIAITVESSTGILPAVLRSPLRRDGRGRPSDSRRDGGATYFPRLVRESVEENRG
jgi:hypothetical protein